METATQQAEPMVVEGDTFKHRVALKQAGGEWDAASKTWTVPAGAKLPAGLEGRPVSVVRAEREESAKQRDPLRSEVGKPVVRTHRGRPEMADLADSVKLTATDPDTGAVFPVVVERHVERHSQGRYATHSVSVYYKTPGGGWERFEEPEFGYQTTDASVGSPTDAANAQAATDAAARIVSSLRAEGMKSDIAGGAK